MLDKEQILAFVKENGPILPRAAVKEFGGDTFLIGAVLSQLVDAKQIKLSSAKIGSSPVYYAHGQESKLEILYNYLKDKEKQAYDILKEEKVLRDRITEPSIRVALRNIRDFAKALEVNIQGNREIFWKWYLFPNSEAETIIREIIKKNPPTSVAEKQEIKQELEQKLPKVPSNDQPVKTEKQENLEKPKSPLEDKLLQKIEMIFSEKQIRIHETEVIRKNSEIEMLIGIPTTVGELHYFCKIRDKKKNNDKDLSSAFVQGNLKKLPVLYVTSGEITKKAKEMLESEFKMITVMNI